MHRCELVKKGRGDLHRSVLARAVMAALVSGALLPSAALAAEVPLNVARDTTANIPGDYASPYDASEVKVNGTLVLRDGAVLNNSGVGEVGVSLPGTGSGVLNSEVRISGAGTRWNQSASLDVGFSIGSVENASPVVGSLRIDGGGALVSGGAARFGTGFAGSAKVFVSGAGSLLSAQTLDLFNGSMDVQQGGTVKSGGNVQIGGYLSGRTRTYRTSLVRVDGAGSRLESGGDVRVVEKSMLTVSNGATVSANRIVTQGLLNIGGGLMENSTGSGGYIIDVPTAPGQIDAAVVRLEDSGALNFNHNSSDYVFSSRVESAVGDSLVQPGTPRINLYGGTTRMTGDSAAFTGQTTVFSKSRLFVDGKLGGSVAVGNGGTLGGVGTIGGNVTIDKDGVLAPGNSIGQLSIGGDLTFQKGSIFQVEVTPQGASDRVSVAGKAVIQGGSVMWVSNDAGFRPFTEYTLIDAKGGVTGVFDNVNNDYAFLSVRLGNTPQTVTLQLIRNDVGFAEKGVTANQRAAAAAAESTGSNHSLWNALVVLNAAQARTAFDQLSGEVHASTRGALAESASEVRGEVLTHLRESDIAAGSSLWAQAFGRWGKTDGDGNAAQIDRDSSGLLVGAEVTLADHWRLGGLLGAGRTRNDVDERVSHSESDDRYFGVYGEGRWDKARLRLGAIRSQHEIETRRSALGQPTSLTAKYDADSTQLFGEFGYAFEVGSFELEPFLGVAQVKLDFDGFRERGGLGALVGQSEDATVRYSTLGLRLGTPSSSADGWHFGGLLGWRRASGDIDPVSRVAFDAGSSFLVAGAPIARNAAVVEANVSTQLGERTNLSFGYAGQIASDADDHGASAKLTVKF